MTNAAVAYLWYWSVGIKIDVTVSFCFACVFNDTTFWIHSLCYIRTVGLKIFAKCCDN